jgi:steroid delta-isomerase-like uncharacterized protein
MSVTAATDVRNLVLEWTECFNRHDPDGAAGHMAPDCVFTNVGNGTRLEGRDAFRDDAVNLLAMWSELHFDTTQVLVTGDAFTKLWVMTGVHTGDVPGLPATGKPFRIRGCGVGRVHDGQIAEVTEYWNMAEFLTQVGILPAPA